ncbi:MAG: BlaI/MecI/CopY family transcriptional regulator [Anaeroplasmataceae bacterium]|nr:BlaI/MecI/CopY family transcriptional regulator [Anaeroplasmataceae bacterium]
MGKHGLSNIEYEIMEFFWHRDEPASFKEILDYFNTEKGMNWKKQTLGTYLSNLRKSGMIEADDKK